MAADKRMICRRLNGALTLVMTLALLLCSSCAWMHEPAEADEEPVDAYLTIALDTGGGGGSRAESTLEDGSEMEYSIKNAILLLFKGADLDLATFCAGAPMVNITPTGSTSAHISRRYKAKFYLKDFDVDPGTNYWAVIIANPNGYMSVTKDTYSYTPGPSQWEVTTIKATDGYTYSSFVENQVFTLPYALQPNGVFAKDGYLTMTNSLFYDKLPPAGDAVQQPLAVNVTGKIVRDPDSVDEGDMAVFYLERVLAKVSVNWTSASYVFPLEYTFDSTAYTTMSASIQGWKLVNLSPTTYLLQHFDDGWKTLRSNDPVHQFYRMVGMPDIGGSYTEDAAYYRVNFSKRSGFADELCTSAAAYIAGKQWGGEWQSGTGQAVYCPENTMAAAHMRVKNATHVLVKVRYRGSDSDFYIIDNKKNALYSLDGLKDWVVDKYSCNLGDVEIVKGSTSRCTVRVSGVAKSDVVDVYSGACGYYLLPISHFGDYYTPWKQGETPTPIPINWEDLTDDGNINRSYPTDNRNDNYLGRWGVVRNNWYQLNINGVSALGVPQDYSVEHTLITNDNTPLDYYESGLRLKLVVDPWTLRDQQIVIITP